MTVPTVIHAQQGGVLLRKLTPEDALPLFELIDKNRLHLSQWDDPTAGKYPDVASVLASIERPENPTRIRFGIWHGERLVGSINLTPGAEGAAELGYWMGSESTGKGYTTAAARALCACAFNVLGYRQITATVREENLASQGVLIKCGFRTVDYRIDRTIGLSLFKS